MTSKALKRLAPRLTEREIIVGLIAHGEQLNGSDHFSPSSESLSGVY